MSEPVEAREEGVLVPRELFFTRGRGVHSEKLQSFELALRDAGIERGNLVRVSSIFPPGCRIVPAHKGMKRVRPGQILHVVIAETATNEPNRLVAAAIGLAQPAAKGAYGYLSEHHSYGETEKRAGDYVEDLAATMLATTFGLEIDANTAYDQRRDLYRMSGHIVRTRRIVQTAEGDKNGRWTTVVAAAVLLF
jgi:arginine decarboxylase